MNYEILSSQSIKVNLDKKDLQKYNLLYSQINKDNAKTKFMFMDIIEKIEFETGTALADKSLYLELLPTKNSGCLIYISFDTEDDTNENGENEYIYFFDNIDNLFKMAHDFSPINSLFKCNSSLYHNDIGFFLIISFDTKYMRFLKSYLTKITVPISSGEINSSYVKEHYSCISSESTIDRLTEIV